MRFLFVYFLLLSPILSAADLVHHVHKMTAQLHPQVLTVGRLGLLEVQPAVVISNDGLILVPKIEAVDEEHSPYLLYHADGRRELLETIEEPKKLNTVLLRSSRQDLPAPVTLAYEESESSSPWFLVPTLSPSPMLGEPATINIIPRHHTAEIKAALAFPYLPPSQPVFSFDGRLYGVSLPPRQRDEGAFLRILPLSKLVKTFKVLSSRLPDKPQSITFSSKTEPPKRPRQPEAMGVILNGDKQITYSVAGTIIREDGLILTKASELGPDLAFQFRGQSYPAVLLATDSLTDLALVGISARNLPVITWAVQNELTPGEPVAFGSTLPELSPELEVEGQFPMAAFSHTLSHTALGLHQLSSVTSLGIIPEQKENRLVISAVPEKSPAAEAGLQIGDEILTLAGRPISNRSSLAKILTDYQVGQTLPLTYDRDETEFETTLTLSSPSFLPATTAIKANTPTVIVPSVVRGPFPEVLVTALPLNAWDCGSPLFDRHGQVHGLVIASVTPNRSLALPVNVIQAAIERMITTLAF